MDNTINMHIAIFAPTGKLIGIDKAERGKNCQCRCYSCQGELVSKQGELNKWHFAHYHNSKKRCDYSFWVVCRDLAKQIFSSHENPIHSMCISRDFGLKEISRISFQDTKIDDIVFDLSFYAKDIGRIFVYFLTPEQNRHQFNYADAFSENVMLINLMSVEHKKEEITTSLNGIITDGLNVKKFFEKRQARSVVNYFAPQISLFEEIEQEERLKKQALEIPKNTPDLSNYKAITFTMMLKEPKLEIDTYKLSITDMECINSLDKIFLNYVKRYGYNYNKHFAYTEIDNDRKVYFISYNERFLGFVMLGAKFVLFAPKNKTLVPVMSTPFRDNIARKIKASMLL